MYFGKIDKEKEKRRENVNETEKNSNRLLQLKHRKRALRERKGKVEE